MAVNINVPSQVRTFANLAAFPASGAVKTIYIAEDTNKTYRWDGSTYVEISASAATGLTVGTTPIASGTVGRVLFEGTGNVLQESANLFWNNTNGWLGIGTSSPIGTLNLVSDTNVLYQQASSANFTGRLFYAFKSGGALGEAMALFGEFSSGLVSRFGFSNSLGNTTFQIGNNGNVQIGTTTDAGFKLDVNGTARVQDNTTITKTQDAITSLSLLNGSTGANASARFYLGNTNTQLAKLSSGYTSGSILKSGDFFMYNQTVGNITFWNNLSTGNINFTTGSASSPQMTLKPSGVLNLSSVPTSPVGLSSGDIWNNLGILTIV